MSGESKAELRTPLRVDARAASWIADADGNLLPIGRGVAIAIVAARLAGRLEQAERSVNLILHLRREVEEATCDKSL